MRRTITTQTAILLIAAQVACAQARETKMSGADPKGYVPKFAWRDEGKDARGIYDHDHRIVRFQERVRTDGGHYADVMFHDVYLRPPGVGPIPAEPQGYLFPRWRFHVYFIHDVEELKAEEQGERLRLTMRTHDREVRDPDKPLYQKALKKHGVDPKDGAHPVFHDEMFLTLTYDPERESYIYDIRSRLTIKPDRKLLIPFVKDHLEYQDLMPNGSFWPHMEGYDRKKYQWQVWEAADGKVYRIPLHHFKSPDKREIRLKPDGLFAYLQERPGNPVIQLLGDTATRSEIAICWWIWDPHIYLLTPDRKTCDAGETFEVHYRLFEMNEADGKALLDRSILRPESSLDGVAAPVFRFGLNTFDEPVSAEVESEDWFWESNESRWVRPREKRHCLWDDTVARSGTRSLALRGDRAGQSWRWQAPFCGSGMRPVPKLAKQQRLTAWVKTKDVGGRVRIGYHVTSEPGRDVEWSERELSGTNDWTQLQLTSSPARPGGNANIILQLDGTGTTWFDDVEVVNVGE